MKVKENIYGIFDDGFSELFEDEIYPEYVYSTRYLELFQLGKEIVGELGENEEYIGLIYLKDYGVWKAQIRYTMTDDYFEIDIDQSIFD